MSATELTVASIRVLQPAVYTNVRFCGTLSHLRRLREREYEQGWVLEWAVRDARGESIRVFSYDDWARALTFANVGDVVDLSGDVHVSENPEKLRGGQLSPTRTPKTGERPDGVELYLSVGRGTAVVVEQAAELGDTLVMRLTHDGLENPEISVKKPKGHSTVLYSHSRDGARAMPEPEMS